MVGRGSKGNPWGITIYCTYSYRVLAWMPEVELRSALTLHQMTKSPRLGSHIPLSGLGPATQPGAPSDWCSQNHMGDLSSAGHEEHCQEANADPLRRQQVSQPAADESSQHRSGNDNDSNQ